MNVTIHKELASCNPEFFKKKLGVHRYDYNATQDANIGVLTLEELNEFKEVVEKNIDKKGAKTLVRDIMSWQNAISGNIRDVKVRKLNQAPGILANFIRGSGRRHIYQRRREGDSSVVLAYYVEKIVYVAATRYSPPCVKIMACYEEFGVIERREWTFAAEECVGKTPPEILRAGGLLLENSTLRADYEAVFVEWEKWRFAYGTQFLAVGAADTNGIDGNHKDDDYRYYYNTKLVRLDQGGIPARVVIDVHQETEKDRRSKGQVSDAFWRGKTKDEDDDDEIVEGEMPEVPDVPVHPYVVIFDLKKHKRSRIHISCLTLYEYNTNIRENLVLPTRHSNLIDTLLAKENEQFKDVVDGKSGGIVVLCQGRPGTGKTLTAEVYAESLRRPLYTVQCSQLGIDSEELEHNLLKVLARGRRWGAVMLLDEADVYVNARGSDLTQNAIVGVFLRVLEYQSGVLFLTTNRGDMVDDAILSRCTARIVYEPPGVDGQTKIWAGLAAANGVALPAHTLADIARRNPEVTGRDIKNLLKLAILVSNHNGVPIDADLIDAVKEFKPA